jgi:hypothetical protein
MSGNATYQDLNQTAVNSTSMTESKNLACAFALLVLASGLAACRHGSTAQHTDALIVCPGAERVSWEQFQGTDQLAYQVKIEYPADSIIACISKQLSENGWQPLKEDFWNPGLPSSHVRGWTQFTDATVHPEATVDAWASQWQNQAGDIVWYSFRYVYPPGDRHTLDINAGFVPANIAKKMAKTPQPESQRTPAAKTTVHAVQPSQSNSTPAVDDCGLTAFPVSMSAKEILAAVPRSAAPRNPTMFAKIEIDPEGKVTHLRVLRLAHPELPNAAAINEQAVDSIKRWRYAPTRIAGKPVSVCSDVDVIIDLQ